jgi:hypothetical protein
MKRADAPVGGIGDTAPSPDRGSHRSTPETDERPASQTVLAPRCAQRRAVLRRHGRCRGGCKGWSCRVGRRRTGRHQPTDRPARGRSGVGGPGRLWRASTGSRGSGPGPAHRATHPDAWTRTADWRTRGWRARPRAARRRRTDRAARGRRPVRRRARRSHRTRCETPPAALRRSRSHRPSRLRAGAGCRCRETAAARGPGASRRCPLPPTRRS